MRFGVSFGLVVPPSSGQTWQTAVHDAIQAAPVLEELGYDSVQMIEHHFQPDGHSPAPLMVLAAMSALTSRVTLGTNILLPNFYHPVKLAEDISALDNMSNGRLTIGVAPGYVTEEFAGFMVPYESRASRFEEIIDILQGFWSNEIFEHEGKYFTIPPTRLSPKPIQKNGPEIWYGVSGPRMLQRAADRHALFTGSPRHSVDELAEHLKIYHDRAAEIGFTPHATPIMRGIFLAETTERAEEIAGPAVTHLFRELYGKKSAEGERKLTNDKGEIIEDQNTVTFETFKDRYLIGTPDDVIPKIEELRDRIGMTELIGWMQLPGMTQDHLLSSAKMFATEVIPAFK